MMPLYRRRRIVGNTEISWNRVEASVLPVIRPERFGQQNLTERIGALALIELRSTAKLPCYRQLT